VKKLVPILPLAALLLGVLPAKAAGPALPAPQRISLSNGLIVYVLKNPDLPLVSFRMFIGGAGSACEAPEVEGAANLAAALLTKGTTGMGADAVAEALDFMGASLSFSAAEEYVQVSGDSLAEHFPRLMEIAAGCLAAPAFKEDEFAKERALRIDGLKAAKDNPGLAVRYYFQKAYFGDHPLGRLSSGTEASLAKMTVQTIKDLHASRYRPDRAIAAVVGDVDTPALKALLEKTLGRWRKPAGPAPAQVFPALPKPQGVKLLLVDKPDATQAYFVLGGPGYAMGDRITPQATIMNTLFGGRFTSWLNTELRIKRGLTYGASSSFRSWVPGGIFQASSYTKNDKIGEMLDIVFDLLKRAEAGFGAEDVESARNYVQGQFPQQLETNASKASAYVRLAYYKMGFDYYDKDMAAIGRVSPAEAKAAAAALLPRKDYVLVVVGKAAEIKPLLAKFGTWQEKKISDPGF